MLSYILTILIYVGAGGVGSPGAYRVGTPTSGRYIETCEATIFCQKGDRWCGGKTVFLGRRVRPNDVGVAHRTLPFGATIKITNHRTKLSTTAKVIDRGPFGRINTRGRMRNGIKYYRKFLRAKKPIPTTMWAKGIEGWRGCIDVTPIVARRIKLNGKEIVTFKVVKWPKVRKRRKRKPNT